jgi:hypothetical protein
MKERIYVNFIRNTQAENMDGIASKLKDDKYPY